MYFDGLTKTQKITLFAGLAVFMIGLGMFAYLGIYLRYWADDWCYNADFRNLGFLETLRGYAYNVTYTPSRYSVTILAGLFYPLGVFGLQLLIPLSLLLWTTGLVRLFRNISSLSGHPHSTPQALLLAAMIIYFSIYHAPHLYQSLYWNTGFFTYTFPLVLIPWVLALVTDALVIDKPSPSKIALLAVLSLLTGGFSEASCTVLVSSLAFYTISALVGLRYCKPWARKTFFSALVALMFALIAMTLLILAPTTQIRAERYGEPASPPQFIVLLFNFTRAFVTLSVKDYQQLIIAILAVLFGFVTSSKNGHQINVWKAAGLELGVFVLAVLLIAASLAPSAYVEKGLPILRTQIIPQYIVVFAFVAMGWLAGYTLRNLYSPAWFQAAATFGLLVTFLFPIFTIFNVAENIPIYRERAQLWDERDSKIQSAIVNNAERIEALAIDGAPVGGIRDFDPPGKRGFWISRCAMDYYGIKFQVILP